MKRVRDLWPDYPQYKQALESIRLCLSEDRYLAWPTFIGSLPAGGAADGAALLGWAGPEEASQNKEENGDGAVAGVTRSRRRSLRWLSQLKVMVMRMMRELRFFGHFWRARASRRWPRGPQRKEPCKADLFHPNSTANIQKSTAYSATEQAPWQIDNRRSVAFQKPPRYSPLGQHRIGN